MAPTAYYCPMLKEHIKYICMVRGMTLQRLAQEVGVSIGAMSNWQRGKAIPASRYVPRLAEVLELDVHELIAMLDRRP